MVVQKIQVPSPSFFVSFLWLVFGYGRFPPVRVFSAGGKSPKRRSPPATAASPKFSLRTRLPPPVSILSQELSSPPQSCPPMSAPLIGVGGLLRLRGPLSEENIQKDHHLRPQQLRRSSAAHNAIYSGQHSLPGAELAGATTTSDERQPHRSWQFPPVKGCSAGGNHPKRQSPPTTAASPEFGRPQRNLLRPAFSRRS